MLEIVRTRPTPSTGYTPPAPCIPNNGNLGIGQRCSKCAPCVAPQVTQDFHRATSQLFQRHLIRQNNRSYVLHNLYLVRNGQVFAQRSVDLRLLVHHGPAQIDESPEFLHNSTTILSRAYHFSMMPSIIQFHFLVSTRRPVWEPPNSYTSTSHICERRRKKYDTLWIPHRKRYHCTT